MVKFDRVYINIYTENPGTNGKELYACDSKEDLDKDRGMELHEQDELLSKGLMRW